MADSVASSSDSDDDFLTLNEEGGSSLDREALVRKKLLESFYGKSAVAETTSPGSNDTDDDDEDDDGFLGRSRDNSSPKRSKGSSDGKNDLDSPEFDLKAHTRRHVVGSSVHTLLATEDKLALQVRTLDSTMQTLVYENYSRFIDATDAIRSIGVNVQANEEGLVRLTKGMQSIDETSKSIEDELGSLRDQVAEKIRVKRLLTRLDSLLKLPQTLRAQIAAGKYRTATTTYLSASSILSKHSEGFESLKSIEAECQSILEELKEDLRNRLMHWSGRASSAYEEEVADSSKIPDPPKNIAEIFECAGTLVLLINDNDASEDTVSTAEDLQSLSLSASIRLLDRLLDTHLIEVQDRRYAVADPSLDATSVSEAPQIPADSDGSFLVPSGVLNAILEVSKLFGISFGNDPSAGQSLVEFVSESFSSFLIHVRSILLEESYQTSKEDEAFKEDSAEIAEVQDGLIDAEAEISATLSIIVHSVRELASALASLEVGISEDYASGLVDQVVSLSESMVRRRVDQKFLRLRQNVVKKCISPFVERAVKERATCINAGKPAVRSLAQIASVMLSDCLQLVDDTIRSIVMSNSSSDLPTVKDAVQNSVQRFASWLAGVFEVMVGGETSDPSQCVEAPVWSDESESDVKEKLEGTKLRLQPLYVAEDIDDLAREDEEVIDLIHMGYREFLSASGESAGNVDSDFILALAELCHQAERSVSAQLNQTVATHLGGNKKKAKGIFPSGDTSKVANASEEHDEVTKRFRGAASRLIILFATNRGFTVSNILCQDLSNVLCQEKLEEPLAPRDAAWRALELVKSTSLECAVIFGGKAKAGPVADLDMDFPGLSSSSFTRKTGLQLDVERMFKTKVAVYPHPSICLETSRNGIMFILLQVALRPLVELVRMSNVSPAGFQQLQIDAMFLHLLIPHYIDKEFTWQGGNACSALSTLLDDVMSDAGTRCVDAEIADCDDIKIESRNALRGFMEDIEVADIANKFIINDDDELEAEAESMVSGEKSTFS